jgi:hypothetical protein
MKTVFAKALIYSSLVVTMAATRTGRAADPEAVQPKIAFPTGDKASDCQLRAAESLKEVMQANKKEVQEKLEKIEKALGLKYSRAFDPDFPKAPDNQHISIKPHFMAFDDHFSAVSEGVFKTGQKFKKPGLGRVPVKITSIEGAIATAEGSVSLKKAAWNEVGYQTADRGKGGLRIYIKLDDIELLDTYTTVFEKGTSRKNWNSFLSKEDCLYTKQDVLRILAEMETLANKQAETFLASLNQEKINKFEQLKNKKAQEKEDVIDESESAQQPSLEHSGREKSDR